MVKPSETEISGGISYGSSGFYDNLQNNPYYNQPGEGFRMKSSDLTYGEYIRQKKRDDYAQEKMRQIAKDKKREELEQEITEKIIKKQQQETGWKPGPAGGPLLGAQGLNKWGNTTQNEFFGNRGSEGFGFGNTYGAYLNMNTLIVILFIILIIIIGLLYNKIDKLENYVMGTYGSPFTPPLQK